MDSMIAALISFFIIDPIRTEMADRLVAARAPQAVMSEVSACARSAVPLLVERATSDPLWAASSTFDIWFGESRPETLLVEVAPGCASAVSAARPFLTGRAA